MMSWHCDVGCTAGKVGSHRECIESGLNDELDIGCRARKDSYPSLSRDLVKAVLGRKLRSSLKVKSNAYAKGFWSGDREAVGVRRRLSSRNPSRGPAGLCRPASWLQEATAVGRAVCLSKAVATLWTLLHGLDAGTASLSFVRRLSWGNEQLEAAAKAASECCHVCH
jgi:hypothetical protein